MVDLNVEHLREFVTIAEFGNLTRAASRLVSSQPVLSRHVRVLEEELEIKLLERDGSGVALTAAGLGFLPHALEIIRAHDAVIAWAHDLRHLEPARLCVESFIGFKKTDDMVGAVRAGLAAQYRNLDFSWKDIKSGDPLDDLLAGRCDLVFVSLLEADLPDGCTAVPVLTEPLVAVVGQGNPLAAYARMSLERLARETLWENTSASRLFAAVCRAAMAQAGGPVATRPLPWTDAVGYYDQVSRLDQGYVLDFESVAQTAFNQLLCHTVRTDPPVTVTMPAVWRRDNGNPALGQALEMLAAARGRAGASYSQLSSPAALAPATRPK